MIGQVIGGLTGIASGIIGSGKKKGSKERLRLSLIGIRLGFLC